MIAYFKQEFISRQSSFPFTILCLQIQFANSVFCYVMLYSWIKLLYNITNYEEIYYIKL